jgi:hypothetical protein
VSDAATSDVVQPVVDSGNDAGPKDASDGGDAKADASDASDDASDADPDAI